MFERLSQKELLVILKEAQQIGETNQSLTSKELVKEIEKMLLLKEIKCS